MGLVTERPHRLQGPLPEKRFFIALQKLNPGKAPGLDSICYNQCDVTFKSWLPDILSSCLCRLKISKILKALVVAILKAMNSVKKPNSYHPIYLLFDP